MQRVMVFDLDGTLVDSVPDLTTALNATLGQAGVSPLTAAEVQKMVGDGVQPLLDRGFAARGTLPGEDAHAYFMTVYGAHVADGTRLFPGVLDGLQQLADAGWVLAVCTNKPETLARQVLDCLGISRFFTAIGGGDSFPTRKPDPAHLIATIAATGCPLSQAMMVGDHANDVKAANGAGIPCIFAGWGYGSRAMAEGATAIAEEFSDILGKSAFFFEKKNQKTF